MPYSPTPYLPSALLPHAIREQQHRLQLRAGRDPQRIADMRQRLAEAQQQISRELEADAAYAAYLEQQRLRAMPRWMRDWLRQSSGRIAA
jgi:hypothetical protein